MEINLETQVIWIISEEIILCYNWKKKRKTHPNLSKSLHKQSASTRFLHKCSINPSKAEFLIIHKLFQRRRKIQFLAMKRGYHWHSNLITIAKIKVSYQYKNIKSLSKIFANRIQLHDKEITHQYEEGFISEM